MNSSIEQTAREIFGERAAFYTTSATHTDPHVLARVVELAAPEGDMSALDVATGTGHTAFALAPRVARVVGADLTPQMLAEGERLARERGVPNVRFCLADAHALPFDTGAFHVVTCRRAAHHFSNIRLALREMKRVLRPLGAGRLVIDDRSVPEDEFVDECMNDLDRLHDESHVRQYRPAEWVRMLGEAGFTVETVEPYTKHRPLTSLTEGVSPENVRKICAIVDGLSDGQKQAMHVTEKEGQVHLNHWYVMIGATSV
jgi:ubiquinone/menaquinone biosynthesis C-methylase UbiE